MDTVHSGWSLFKNGDCDRYWYQNTKAVRLLVTKTLHTQFLVKGYEIDVTYDYGLELE